MNPIHFEIEETAVTIVSDEKYHKVAKDAIFEAREIIKKKISEDDFFRTTYDPYPVDVSDDYLIKRMCHASEVAGVGPMASVAGAVAVYAVEKMVHAGAQFAIVENGGDIAIKADRDVTVGLYSDNDRFKDLALHIKKRDKIFGVCTSSGKIGPSVSLGSSNVSTVISNDVILADACATALGNMSKDSEESTLSNAVESIMMADDDIDCCFVISGELLVSCGDMPELVRCSTDRKAAGLVYTNL